MDCPQREKSSHGFSDSTLITFHVSLTYSHQVSEILYYGEGAMDKPKLLDEVRDLIRVKHDSIRTEEADLNWIN